ncbi:hypothetical protein MMC24_006260 [Lignoscripta atroalba]|nr:hypothetical protein [Lignoscripta atroalba]
MLILVNAARRKRHIKCDEEKPSCLKCRSSGFTCDGYAVVKNRLRGDSKGVLCWAGDTGTITSCSLSFDLPGTELERQCFHFFRNETVVEISGWFESNFWNRLVLQVSHAQPAVRHLVTALGSLHQRLLVDETVVSENSYFDTRHQFALQQCNKAIGYLSVGFSAGSPQSVEVTLIACVLFVCYECLLGNHDAALTHFQNGLNILRNCRASNHQEPPKKVPVATLNHSNVEADLVQLFSRLDFQTTMFRDIRLHPADTPQQHKDMGPRSIIPKSFSNLNQARDSFDNLLHQCVSIRLWLRLRHLPELESKSCSHESFPGHEQTNRDKLQVAQWLTAFNAFLAESSTKMNCRDLQGAILLKIYHKVSSIILSASGLILETAFDKYTSDFEYVNSLAASLVEASNATGPSRSKINFTLDMGVVSPLQFVASRCRDPAIRRRSISLLYASRRREGVWDGICAGKIAERQMAIEESGLDVGTDPQRLWIPESARICSSYVIFDHPRRCALLQYGQRRNGMDGNLHFQEEWISW